MDDSMTVTPSTVAELIEAFGGSAKYGRVIGKGASTASEQKRNGSIPVEYWEDIITAAGAAGIAGITYESLVKMHNSKRAGVSA
jgi:hypothetical protein